MERLPFPPHELVIDEERFLTLLADSLSLLPVEKQRILENIPSMTQEQYDRIIGIFETEKTQIDAVQRRGEKIRRLIESLRIMAALDWAEVGYGLFSKKP